MDLLPAALFLVPGAVGSVSHRFAAAQSFSGATQLLLAVAYSGLTYALLATPVLSWLATSTFPTTLFAQDARALADPEIGYRLLVIAVFSGVSGLVLGRLSMYRRVHQTVIWLTGRNLHASVWAEAFLGAPRQWIRLKSAELDLVGWLESASDNSDERAVLISNAHEVTGTALRPIVGGLILVHIDSSPVVVFLGTDVEAAVKRASTA